MGDAHDPSAAGTTQTGEQGAPGTPTPPGNGQGTQPAQSGSRKTEDVELGIRLGQDRLAKKLAKRLGLDLDEGHSLDDLIEAAASKREPAAPAAEPDPAKVLDHPEVRKLATELTKTKADLRRYEKDTATLRAQADRSREVELSALALAAGIGPGKQLEAFIRIYGEAVRYDETAKLRVMARLEDGTMIPAGQTVEEYVAAAVAEAPFLRRLDQSTAASGSGSRIGPARTEPAPTGHEEWRAGMLKRAGIQVEKKR